MKLKLLFYPLLCILLLSACTGKRYGHYQYSKRKPVKVAEEKKLPDYTISKEAKREDNCISTPIISTELIITDTFNSITSNPDTAILLTKKHKPQLLKKEEHKQRGEFQKAPTKQGKKYSKQGGCKEDEISALAIVAMVLSSVSLLLIFGFTYSIFGLLGLLLASAAIVVSIITIGRALGDLNFSSNMLIGIIALVLSIAGVVFFIAKILVLVFILALIL